LWAGLNLEAADLPHTMKKASFYPLEMVRALVITWLFAGLRLDEIRRLRVGCIRWQHDDAVISGNDNEMSKELVCLLDVPINKTGTAFTKAVDRVVGDAVAIWGKLRYDQPAVLREIAKLDDSRLAQFMMLCSFAHYGANQYKHNQVDQKPVMQLSRERKINHALIDARARAELCAKKYKATHQAYLEAVTEGRAAKKPAVYEQPPQKGKAETVRKAKARSAARFKSAKANAGKRKTGASDARV
jgi:hypothetical protein